MKKKYFDEVTKKDLEEAENRLKEGQDGIINTLDSVMKQLETIQEEQSIGFGQIDELVTQG